MTPASAPRAVLHVDMDAFYASVEALDDPSLRGRPVIVGGDGPRGVVASCSYEARATGVRSAMSGAEARRRCPDAVFVAGRHARYSEVSSLVHAVFGSVTPLVEPIALDEAFLDVSGARHGRAPWEIGAGLRRAVFDATGLTCSVGVATCKLIAKLASESAKPYVEAGARAAVEPVAQRSFPPGAARGGGRTGPVVVHRRRPGDGRDRPGSTCRAVGVVEVEAGDEITYLHPHPARALWGVGPATMDRLARFGVHTVGDIAALPRDTLVRALGDSLGVHLHRLAMADDPRPVEPDRPTRSIGHEETFERDLTSVDAAHVEVLRMADAVGGRLRRAGLTGRTVAVKLKWPDFTITTRSRTLPRPTDGATTIARTATELLHDPVIAERITSQGVRLIGVSVANLGESGPGAEAPQLSLFDAVGPQAPGRATAGAAPGPHRFPAGQIGGALDGPEDDAVARVDEVVARVRERFGHGALAPASLVRSGRIEVRADGMENPWDASGGSPD